MKKIGLALSGGGAYGFAHIGVLKVLLENNIPIDIVTGTSMGALIGGLFASGITPEKMKEILNKFSKNKIFDFNPFVLMDTGLIFGNKVKKYLKTFVGDKNIEDCDVKFACVASDLCAGKKVVFEKGPIVDAIRASISVPGMFRPVQGDNKCLVDGCLTGNLPVEEARNLGAEFVIAVDVSSYYKKQKRIRHAFDVLINSMNLLVINYISKQQDKGDFYLKIDQPNVSFEKFTYEGALKSYKYGENMAKKMLPDIKKALENF